MLFSIVAQDKDDSLQKRIEARPDHVARLNKLKNAGRLVVAGPNPAVESADPGTQGYTGSIIIAEFDSLQDAKLWADNDPYIKAGVYTSVTVKPFNKVLP